MYALKSKHTMLFTLHSGLSFLRSPVSVSLFVNTDVDIGRETKRLYCLLSSSKEAMYKVTAYAH